jgi:nitronate monooxygenase
MVREPPALITAEIARVRAATTRDFGVNLSPAATDPQLLEAEIAAVLAARVPVVALASFAEKRFAATRLDDIASCV